MSSNSKTSKNSYLAALNVKHSLPELKTDLLNTERTPDNQTPEDQNSNLPEYLQTIHHGPFLWIGQEGHHEYMHVDPDEGMLMILHGKKRVCLFGYDDFQGMEPHAKGSSGRTIQSSFDLECETDQEKVKARSGLIGELNSGDILYIPAFFWHQVTTITKTVSLNCFWGQSGSNFDQESYSARVLNNNHEIRRAVDYWWTNIIEQNRPFSNFKRILSRLPEVVWRFFLKQWKEELNEKQVDSLVQVAMDYLKITDLPERDENDNSKVPPELKIRGLRERHGNAIPSYSIHTNSEKNRLGKKPFSEKPLIEKPLIEKQLNKKSKLSHD